MAATNNESMTREATFDLLSSSVRRTLVVTLRESGTVGRDELTETLAAAEADGGEDARRRIRIALHHNHLPRLADAGLVVYDDETVTPTNRLEALAGKITNFDEGDKPLARA